MTKKDIPPDPSHTHKWSVYVKGVDGEDISYLFKRITIKIHESFSNPTRVFEGSPMNAIVQESGWGEFQVVIRLTLHDPGEKIITLNHYLQLYSKEDAASLPANQPPPIQKKPVIIENYEEIVFVDPIQEVYDKLMANPIHLPLDKGIFSIFFDSFSFVIELDQLSEKRELEKIKEYKSILDGEYEKLAMQVSRAENEYKRLQSTLQSS